MEPQDGPWTGPLSVYGTRRSIAGGIGKLPETISAHWPMVFRHIHDFLPGPSLIVSLEDSAKK